MAYLDPEKQRAFQRQWQRSLRRKRKLWVIELLGGGCKRCGYKENPAALQVDHIAPLRRPRDKSGTKTTGQHLLNLLFRGIETTDNIQLLCANCHAIKTYEEDRTQFKSFNKVVFVPLKKRTKHTL